PMIVERAYNLECGHDAVGAVELAAGRLRVEVTPRQHRRKFGAPTRPPGEDIADRVDGDRAARVLTTADEAAARLAVQLRQRKPANAALRSRADLGQVHQ